MLESKIRPDIVNAWVQEQKESLEAYEKRRPYSTSRVKEVDRYFKALTECGWFRGYPRSVLPIIKARLLADYSKEHTGKGLETVAFDTEMGGAMQEGYHAILSSFEKGSFGILQLTEIRVERSNGKIGTLSFKNRKKAYKAPIDASTDYFDESVFDSLQEALRASHPFFQFFLLPYGAQDAYVALVDPKAHQRSVDKGLIKKFQPSQTPPPVDEVRPPWIEFADSTPWWEGWRRGEAEIWLHAYWRPFWRRLSALEQKEYLERWLPPSNDWREQIRFF